MLKGVDWLVSRSWLDVDCVVDEQVAQDRNWVVDAKGVNGGRNLLTAG